MLLKISTSMEALDLSEGVLEVGEDVGDLVFEEFDGVEAGLDFGQDVGEEELGGGGEMGLEEEVEERGREGGEGGGEKRGTGRVGGNRSGRDVGGLHNIIK